MHNHSMSPHRYPALLLSLAFVLVFAGCGSREVEGPQGHQPSRPAGHDAGLVDGQNKLVPSVSFHLQNVTAEPIESVQVNAVFRQVTEHLAWGDRLIRGVGSDGLAGGATGRALVVRSPRGYTRHPAPHGHAAEQGVH